MLDGKRFLPLTGTPMPKILFSRTLLADCDPEPFTVATWMLKSLTMRLDAEYCCVSEPCCVDDALVVLRTTSPVAIWRDPFRGKSERSRVSRLRDYSHLPIDDALLILGRLPFSNKQRVFHLERGNPPHLPKVRPSKAPRIAGLKPDITLELQHRFSRASLHLLCYARAFSRTSLLSHPLFS